MSRKAAALGIIARPAAMPLLPCAPMRRGFARVWSYNAETLLMPGRLDEVLKFAAAARVDVLALQGTMLSIEHVWESEDFVLVPSPRSAANRKDGVAIAISKRLADKTEVKVTHRWQLGRLVGARITRGRHLDFYVLCGYAPNNEPDARPVTAAAHAACRHEKEEFFGNLGRALSCIPRRCAVVLALDANGSMAPALPEVGQAGSRRQRGAVWTDNGKRLNEVLVQFGLRALNTFGSARGTSSTWRNPDGQGETRIDFIASTMRTGARYIAKVHREVPIALGSARDHMIVEASCRIGAYFPKRQKCPPKATWDRTGMTAALAAMNVFKYEEKHHGEGGRFTETVCKVMRYQSNLTEAVGKLDHMLAAESPTTFYDQLEMAVIKAASEFKAEATNRKFFAFTDEPLAKVQRKQVACRWATWLADHNASLGVRLQAEASARWLSAEAKRATRSERRQAVQNLADEATTAAKQRDMRQCFKLINKIAPKPSPAMVTVNSKEGQPCMDAAAETIARKEALQDIFQAVEIDMQARPAMETTPEPPPVAERLPHLDQCTIEQVESMIHRMPNFKAAPPIDQEEAGQPRPRGAVAELWKLACCGAAAGVGAAAGAVQTLVRGIARCGQIPAQFKDGVTAQLRKPKGDGSSAKDHYRTLNILDHLGKGVSKLVVKPFLGTVAKGIEATQFGATAGRATRDAIAVIDEVFRRFRHHMRGKKVGRILGGVLVDLEKAFDLLNRAQIWEEVERIVANAGFTLLCEEMHNGTCYLFKDPRSGKIVAKLEVNLGMRQGSVEGPHSLHRGIQCCAAGAQGRQAGGQLCPDRGDA